MTSQMELIWETYLKYFPSYDQLKRTTEIDDDVKTFTLRHDVGLKAGPTH